ncbi:hypothetical protein FC50_GL001212 [Lacticaseibacillus pantheris DSM 15945 = JCM 12539 = NBRC 106106]|uniref:Uncharacterized protein n=1 Tax=Lacticaseibacillus pantheris DSM 15945 = JCM 12539 = NBRC 106106 TaxID=1423783 RepID=A0A0R1TX87_9LACO|nr:hypothetical protein FC50_GL001212 [Lacticaseibacillus pantheris DSM 15945 = JCM 12539 = NBRC 106106]
MNRLDWAGYNRIIFTICSNDVNVINSNVTVAFKNDGVVKIPDKYMRDGFHSINLANDHKPHQYHLDISDLPRDAITEISFSSAANGSYMNMPGKIDIEISDIILGVTQNSSKNVGWRPTDGVIIASQLGYDQHGRKSILVSDNVPEASFEVIDQSTNRIVLDGKLTKQSVDGRQLFSGDFSELSQPGKYEIRVSGCRPETVQILPSNKIWSESVLDSLNFIYSQRCGAPVPGVHGTCHTDVFAEHNGMTVPFNGGWHDAGDLSQQSMQTGEVALSLLEVSSVYQKEQPAFAARLEEEAEWGLDFILKTRFGDGYRATSAGTSRWTDNQIGNFDDVRARTHNSAYDNFLFAGIEGKAALVTNNTQLKRVLTQAAISDFEFASAVFMEHPYKREPIMWEHTYNTSKSSYDSTIAWTAAVLFKLTHDDTYQQKAISAGKRLLTYQERGGITVNGRVVKGVFYRDETHTVFQHFNHQSREHLFAFALAELIKITTADEQQLFKDGARMYGDYLLWLQQYTAPYPMISSGLYFDDEQQDKDSFHIQHLLTDATAESEYGKQLQKGIKIADHLYVKRFPVWFSFRGNNGILLSTALGAATLGDVLHDAQLRQLAENQLYWIAGENPFGKSLMLGLGHKFDDLYAVSSGPQVGALPVGIETRDDEDAPYWPQFNNATYKEVWISNSGRWLSVIATLLKSSSKEKQQ